MDCTKGLWYNSFMEENMDRQRIAVIIGAGPAGLSTAYNLLLYTDIKPLILEELDCAGGISRTIFYNDNGTDLGPHRLFTKNNEVLDMWENLLPLQGKPPIDDKILNRSITVNPVVQIQMKQIELCLSVKEFQEYII